METRTILIIVAALVAGIVGYMMISGGMPMPQTPNPIAQFETSMGNFDVELYVDKAPITAENFVTLAESGFYDGLIFHRIIDGFVIQGGDPLGTGEGGPGHTIPLEIHPELRHDAAGVIAMARAQDPDSAGSQFYFSLDALPRLDDNYAVFGRVIDGLDVVLEIGQVETDDTDRPVEEVVITQVTIVHP